MRGILDMFENPLTLGGMGLLSGGGWDGAMSGMRMGAGMQDRRRQQDAFDGLLSGSNVDQGMLPLLKAMGPEKGIEFLAQQRDPMRQMQLKQAQHELSMAPLDRQYKQAQINRLNREPAGGETPSNVREWEYYSKLPPEQQQQYLNMRRAQKMYDTGMEFVQPNAVNPAGPPVATIQKRPGEVETAKEVGQAQGKAQVSLPQAEYNAKKLTALLDGVLNDPYLPNMTGSLQGRLPNLSGASNRVQSKLDQIQGKTFLMAFESLKGAGQITEIEGQKATESLNRLMNAKQGTQDYVDALREFKQDVSDMVNVVRQKANGSYTPPQPKAPKGRSLDLGDGFTAEFE